MTTLAEALPGLNVVTDPDVLRTLGHDEAEWAPAGDAVGAVRARSTEDVRRIVARLRRTRRPGGDPRRRHRACPAAPTRSTAA